MLTPTVIYRRLLATYGPQGWWPVGGLEGGAGARDRLERGYHPGDYSYPRTDAEQFEICIGAILTQNTAWKNVERALVSLHGTGGLRPSALLAMSQEELAAAIRSSGYFNAKTRKLRVFSEFHLSLAGRTPSRAELLNLWGVGPETGDSMLLYAFGQLHMVVDAYTRRIFEHLGLITDTATYDDIADLCEADLPRELVVYQEMHALLVEHAKRHYRRRPYADPLFVRTSQ